MNQRGFANVILVVIIVVLVGAVGYFVLVEKLSPTVQQTNTPIGQPQDTQSPSASSENNFKTYTLDVSNITSRESGSPVTGNLIISHNAVAVFPMNLENQIRKLGELSPATIFEAQTKSGCWNQNISENHEVIRNITAAGPLQSRNVASIRKIILEMPYYISQDGYTRRPATFCVGFHTTDNRWVWNTAPVQPVLDDNLKQGRGEITLNAENVDGIAILFDNGTVLKTISFEAAKIHY